MLTTGVLANEKIAINYTLGTKTKTYDAKSYSYDDADFVLSEGSLLQGDKAVFEVISNYTEVGTYEIYYNVEIYDEEGTNVSNNYKIKTTPGSLTIEQRYLHVVLTNNNLENGLISLNDYYLIDNTYLVDGQQLMLRNDSEEILGVVGPNGINLSDNYNIQIGYDYENELVLKVKDITKTYDGNDVVLNYEILSGNLNENDKLEVTYGTVSNSVGNYEVEIIDYKILNGETDVTNNYVVTTLPGNITINKANLEIEVNDIVKYYDRATINLENEYSYTGLAEDDEITLTFADTNYINVGKYTIEIEEIEITNNNNEDVSGNYNIKIKNGSLEIIKKPLTIGFIEELDFDYSNSIPTLSVSKLNNVDLVENDTITNLYVDKTTLDKNVGTYDLYIKNIIIKNSDENVTNNYEITYIPGLLTINKADITINTIKNEVIYNNEYVVDATLTTSLPNLSATVTFKHSNIINGEINDYDTHIYAGNEDVTNNFNIIKNSLKPIIRNKKVVINLGNQEFMYSNDKYNITYLNSSGLLPTDVINNITISSNVIGICNDFNTQIINELGEEVSYYDITYMGQIEIVPRKLTIKINNVVYQYGDEINITAKNSGLLPTDVINNITISSNEIGIYNDFNTQIINELGEEVSYYDITYMGQIEIVPRKLTIKIDDIVYQYGDEIIINHQDNGLLPTDFINNITIPSNEIGIYTNFNAEIVNELGEEVSYYDIKYIGQIEIIPRKLTIKINNIKYQYGDEIIINHQDNGLLPTDTIKNITIPSNEIGIYTNFNAEIVNELGEKVSYYDIKYIGQIEIVPRELTVNILDSEHQYGDEIIINHQDNGLLPNDSISLDYSSYQGLDVGTYQITPEITIISSNLNADTYYSINIIPGRLTINPKDITLDNETLSQITKTKVYDALPQANQIIEYNGLALEIGYLDNDGKLINPQNAGDYQIYIYEIPNYNLIYDSILFTIEKSQIELNLIQDTIINDFVYTGNNITYYENLEIYNIIGNLYDDIKELDITYNDNSVNAWLVDTYIINKVDVIFYDDVKLNYDIISNINQSFNITKKKIFIITPYITISDKNDIYQIFDISYSIIGNLGFGDELVAEASYGSIPEASGDMAMIYADVISITHTFVDGSTYDVSNCYDVDTDTYAGYIIMI